MAEMLKAKLHILMSLGDQGNRNRKNGQIFVPMNQMVIAMRGPKRVEILLDQSAGVHYTAGSL